MKKLSVIILALLLLSGCGKKVEEKDILAEYHEQIELLEAKLEQSEAALLTKDEQINQLVQQSEELKEVAEDDPENTEGTVSEAGMYKDLYEKFKQYILRSSTETPPQATGVSVNNVFLNANFKDVINAFGEEYEETVTYDDYQGGSQIVWVYDDLEITFDPIMISSIRLTGSEYSTNTGISVGDSALPTIAYCESKYEGVKSRHSNEFLYGWYDIGDDQVMIIYFDQSLSRLEQDIEITEDTKVEKIEIAKFTAFD